MTTVSQPWSHRLGDTLGSAHRVESKATYLVKDLAHVGLGFAKPHGEQLGPLDGDEVCLAFIGNGFSQQCLTTARGPIEQDPFGGSHAEFEEFVWVLHRVLKEGENSVESWLYNKPSQILPWTLLAGRSKSWFPLEFSSQCLKKVKHHWALDNPGNFSCMHCLGSKQGKLHAHRSLLLGCKPACRATKNLRGKVHSTLAIYSETARVPELGTSTCKSRWLHLTSDTTNARIWTLKPEKHRQEMSGAFNKRTVTFPQHQSQ